MPQLAIAAVGAGIGSAVGGTFLGISATSIGWTLGAIAGGLLFQPDTPGAKRQDTRAAKIQLGARIPIAEGTVRLPLNPRWTSDFRSVGREAGGKGGGGGSRYYDYYADGLFWIADARVHCKPILALIRLWHNGKLVWSARAESSDASIENSADQPLFSAVQFHDGNAAQMPWPVYEAAVGTANADAHRRIACVSIENYYSGQSPQWGLFEGEFITVGEQGVSDVVWLLHLNGANGATSTSDDSSYGNDPTMTNATLQSSAAEFGASGAQNDDSGSNTIAATVSHAWDEDTDLTMSSWASAEGDSSAGLWFGQAGPIQYGFVTQGGGGNERYYRINLFDQTFTSDPFDGGEEHPMAPYGVRAHYALLYNGTTHTATMFKDGVPVLVAAYVGTPPTVASITELRCFDSNGNVPPPEWFTQDEVKVTLGRLEWDEGGFTPPITAPIDDGGGRWTIGTEDLEDVTDRVMRRCGLAADEIDNTELAGIPVRGIVFNGTGRQSLEELAAAYDFGGLCRDQLITRLRGGASVATIANVDTGCGEGKAGERLAGVDDAGDDEVPAYWHVTSPDPSADYEDGDAMSDRMVTASVEVQQLRMAVHMTTAERKGRADTFAADAKVASRTFALTLSDEHAALEPLDVVTATDEDGNTYRGRIEGESYASGVKRLQCVLDDASVLQLTGVASTPYSPAVEVAGGTVALLVPIDSPILQDADNDAGAYTAIENADDGLWQGAEVRRSIDGVDYTELVAEHTTEATIGRVTVAPAAGLRFNRWNRHHTLRVDVGLTQTLTSSTEAAMQADRRINTGLVGVNGRQVVIRWCTATLVSTGVYDLGGLQVGRRGSESHVADIVAGDRFVVATTALRRMPWEVADLGAARYLKGVATGRTVSGTSAQSFTNTGVGLKPFAPGRVTKALDASNNATFTLLKRARLLVRYGGTGGTYVPLDEDVERFEIDVYADDTFATVVRTLTNPGANTLTYSAAQQTADGFTPGDRLPIRAYRVSAQVGRGHYTELEAA
jgi:hypothetical protein